MTLDVVNCGIALVNNFTHFLPFGLDWQKPKGWHRTHAKQPQERFDQVNTSGQANKPVSGHCP